MSQSVELCDCSQCQYSDGPCHKDCEPGPEECQGCFESRRADGDAEFHARRASGAV